MSEQQLQQLQKMDLSSLKLALDKYKSDHNEAIDCCLGADQGWGDTPTSDQRAEFEIYEQGQGLLTAMMQARQTANINLFRSKTATFEKIGNELAACMTKISARKDKPGGAAGSVAQLGGALSTFNMFFGMFVGDGKPTGPSGSGGAAPGGSGGAAPSGSGEAAPSGSGAAAPGGVGVAAPVERVAAPPEPPAPPAAPEPPAAPPGFGSGAAPRDIPPAPSNPFDFDFTLQHVVAALPSNNEADEWHAAKLALFPKYGITTKKRIVAFLAQCAVESSEFTALVEGLSYNERTLRGAAYSKYFERAKPPNDPRKYANRPEKWANLYYANRMDNGPPESGDGWRFRGRGVIQLTGRHNYTRFAADNDMPLDDALLAYLETRKGALESACWYWKTHGLNEAADVVALADAEDPSEFDWTKNKFDKISQRINGGDHGWKQRRDHYARICRLYDAPVTQPTLSKGSKGFLVKMMQRKLGIKADGDFGPGTEASVMAWQRANGLTDDGVVTPAVYARMAG